jgi:glycosyltransferase involved in cell wall biosynthesis
MRLTLVATTHERPDALAAVFETVRAQSAAPDELIVADDGSGPATAALIQSLASRASYPVQHVRQEHLGFRAARLRNLAIAHATGDYLVFIDGDMLLHPQFIADHRRCARPGAFTQGMRIPLDAATTEQVLASGMSGTQLYTRGRRMLYARHSPPLAVLTRRLANGFIAIKSCNQGFWRADLVAVNGFDEDFVGWGSEDKELCARLRHYGVARQTLLFGGIAFHLHHPPASRERHVDNEKLLALTRKERRVRCAHGLETHLRPVL